MNNDGDNDDGDGDDYEYENEEEQVKGRPFIDLFLNKLSGMCMWIIFSVALVAYSLAAFSLDFQRSYWLLSVEMIIFGLKAFQLITDKYCPSHKTEIQYNIMYKIDELGQTKVAGIIVIIIMAILVGVFIHKASNLISLVGLLGFLFMSWLTSYDPWNVQWRPVISGLFIQMIVGVLVLKVPVFANVFQWLGDQVAILLNYTLAGLTFVYGYLADPNMNRKAFVLEDETSTFTLNPPFYFSVLTVIFFARHCLVY